MDPNNPQYVLNREASKLHVERLEALIEEMTVLRDRMKPLTGFEINKFDDNQARIAESYSQSVKDNTAKLKELRETNTKRLVDMIDSEKLQQDTHMTTVDELEREILDAWDTIELTLNG